MTLSTSALLITALFVPLPLADQTITVCRPSGCLPFTLGPGIIVDDTTLTLRVPDPPSLAPIHVVVLQPPSAISSLALSPSPSATTPPLITLNGLVLAPNIDYTLSGSVITFTGSLPSANDIITVRYQ